MDTSSRRWENLANPRWSQVSNSGSPVAFHNVILMFLEPVGSTIGFLSNVCENDISLLRYKKLHRCSGWEKCEKKKSKQLHVSYN